ncbi:TPA: hypothetical protein ACFNMH_001927 [Neisseria elongata]|jgi:hypothetical protein
MPPNGKQYRVAIRADFATGNYTRAELAAKYGVSLQLIYGILKDES